MSQIPFLPVPLSPRYDGWTPERQWAFVEVLADTASITQAARIVGMSVRSAQKLRRHPMAGEFRAAWDAALAQAWGSLEQVALDRAINGEVETIERDGVVVASRRRVCSDRLLIHLLKYRETRKERARGEREAAHREAVVAARLAALQARSAAPGRQVPAIPPAPQLPDDAATEAAALTAFTGFARAFVDWPALSGVMPEPGPPVCLSPADGRIMVAARAARVKLPKGEREPEPLAEADPQFDLVPPEPAAPVVEPPSEIDLMCARWERQYAEWDGREETRPPPVRLGRPEVRVRML